MAGLSSYAGWVSFLTLTQTLNSSRIKAFDNVDRKSFKHQVSFFIIKFLF